MQPFSLDRWAGNALQVQSFIDKSGKNFCKRHHQTIARGFTKLT